MNTKRKHMESYFSELQSNALPPEEVRINDLIVEPYPDGKRIHLYVELTPFQLNPSGDILIKNQAGLVVGSSSFIEAVTPKFDFTLHLRHSEPGEYLATLTLFYTNEVEETDPEGKVLFRPERMIVDTYKTSFIMD